MTHSPLPHLPRARPWARRINCCMQGASRAGVRLRSSPPCTIVKSGLPRLPPLCHETARPPSAALTYRVSHQLQPIRRKLGPRGGTSGHGRIGGIPARPGRGRPPRLPAPATPYHPTSYFFRTSVCTDSAAAPERTQHRRGGGPVSFTPRCGGFLLRGGVVAPANRWGVVTCLPCDPVRTAAVSRHPSTVRVCTPHFLKNTQMCMCT